jgi:hypothetical protein
MSKTTFLNGTIVTPAFLNAIFNTSGGHKHDGGADDGSAQRVEITDLAATAAPATVAVQLMSGETGGDVSVIHYIKHGRHVTVYMPLLTASGGSTLWLKCTGDGEVFPAALTPINTTRLPCIVDAGTKRMIGSVLIAASGWVFDAPDASADGALHTQSGVWSDATTNGVQPQCFTYMTNS